MYPKVQEELYDFNVRTIGVGSQFIAVATKDSCLAWGRPVAGKFGLEGEAISSVKPKFVDSVKDLSIIKLSAGYGHLCFLVDSKSEKSKSNLNFDMFPILSQTDITLHKGHDEMQGNKKHLSESSSNTCNSSNKRTKRK